MQWISSQPIAHRGLHSNPSIPENSLRSFEAAVEHNYAIELDVNLLADGGVAVFHDQDLERMTGVKGKIADQDSSTVQQLKLLGTDQSIPLIEDVFELVNGRVPILVEIKNEGAVGALEQALLSKLSHYSGDYAIQAFNPFSLSWFKKNAPHIPRGQLSGDFKAETLAWHKKVLLSNLLMNWASSPHFIAYDLRSLPCVPVTIARTLKVPILAWTIRTEQEKVKALNYADNIIFDFIRP